MKKIFFIADDSELKGKLMKDFVEAEKMDVDIFVEETAQGALVTILTHARQIVGAILDDNFKGEQLTGINLARAIRIINPLTKIAIVTARKKDSPGFQKIQKEADQIHIETVVAYGNSNLNRREQMQNFVREVHTALRTPIDDLPV